MIILKVLLRMKVLNGITAAPFPVSFSKLPAVNKDTENGAAVMSLRTFIRSSVFRKTWNTDFIIVCQNLIGLHS